jgi:hypothetical protein
VTVNGTDNYDFDVIIISAPLHKVSGFMTLTDEEQQLFSQVQSERYLVSLFGEAGLGTEQAMFFYNNSNPQELNHVVAWANRDKATPVFVGYQIADWTASADQITSALAGDVASQGGQLGGILLRQEWDYFPHVDPTSFQQGFYDRVEWLQGKNNTFYVGGTLSFETVEHSARYAQELVQKNFPTPLF